MPHNLKNSRIWDDLKILQIFTKTVQKLLKILRISVNLYHKLQKTAFIGGSFCKTNPIYSFWVSRRSFEFIRG